MSKFYYGICILLILFICILPVYSFATDINMSLSNSTSNTSNTMNNMEQNFNSTSNQNTTDTTYTPTTYSSGGYVSNNLNSLPEANLGLTNILCIILIVLGILLVFLAIAILIRLKR